MTDETPNSVLTLAMCDLGSEMRRADVEQTIRAGEKTITGADLVSV